MTFAQFAVTQGIISAAFCGVWIVTLFARKASYVDTFWGLGFILAAVCSLPAERSPTVRGELLIVLTSVWALRLSSYVAWRNWGEPEDHRYAEMREHHGARFWWVSLFTVFLLQSLLLGIVSLPIQAGVASAEDESLSLLDGFGLGVWALGMFFETVGDWQLARFKADPANKGRVMNRGLWRYTRHPNYFGECCVWWGFFLFGFAGGAPWTIISPILMTFLLLRVSGVSLLERSIVERRPEYAEYQRRTSAFIPWIPKEA